MKNKNTSTELLILFIVLITGSMFVMMFATPRTEALQKANKACLTEYGYYDQPCIDQNYQYYLKQK